MDAPRHTLTLDELRLAGQRVPPVKAKRPMFTPGRAVYLAYHYPRLLWRDGLLNRFQAWRGRSAMLASLKELRPRPSIRPDPAAPAVEVHYLTGKRFLALTSLAAYSAQAAFGRPVRPVFHDDGTLDDADRAGFRGIFPDARIVGTDEIMQGLDERLGAGRFPILRRLRAGYIHLRKLTDIHATSPGAKLVTDSDVLFFGLPRQLLETVASGRWCFMQDCRTSYGYPIPALEALAGARLHPRVNVGILHARSDAIDWGFVEHAAGVLLARHGFSYYLEQALTAMLMARANGEALGPEYMANPDEKAARSGPPVAMHFLDRSILLLYRFGWRRVLAGPAPA